MKTIKELEARHKIMMPHRSTGAYEECIMIEARLEGLKDVIKLIDEAGECCAIGEIKILRELKSKIEGK